MERELQPASHANKLTCWMASETTWEAQNKTVTLRPENHSTINFDGKEYEIVELKRSGADLLVKTVCGRYFRFTNAEYLGFELEPGSPEA